MIDLNPSQDHLPEDERPKKVAYRPFENMNVMVWVAAPKFSGHKDYWASGCGPEDYDDEKMLAAIAEGKRSAEPCKICHKPFFSTTYIGKEADYIKEHGVCFTCAFWSLRMLGNLSKATIINGHWYGPGNATSGPFRGMAGRRFDIEYISGPHAGKRITTFDLWSGGQIPPYWHERCPDNAKFLDNASSEVVGQTRCFNPSSGKTDPYPLPRSLGIGV